MSKYQYLVVDGEMVPRPGHAHMAEAMIESGQVAEWLRVMDDDAPERAPHRLLRAPVTAWEEVK